jgi:hypothetical protein
MVGHIIRLAACLSNARYSIFITAFRFSWHITQDESYLLAPQDCSLLEGTLEPVHRL